ncbi:MAG: diguanylate cyclase [Cyanobacteria bacterium RI_101]|nr:diguanylate cyclase [Cyanobacteria bacterium RI_101]
MFFGRYVEWRSRQLLILINIAAALLYLICIQISYQFINLDPSDRIAPLWLPSALSLSLFFHFEHKILLGILGGSILGAIGVLGNVSPLVSPIPFLLLAITFSLADIIQPILANIWIKKSLAQESISENSTNGLGDFFCPPAVQNPFIRIKTTLAFVQAALLAPLSSAILGAGALAITGVIHQDKILFSLITWWLANALANLVFSPILILPRFRTGFKISHKKLEFAVLILAVLTVSYLTFIKNYPIAYLYLPLVLLSVFLFGGLAANLVVAWVTMVALGATAKGYGVFVQVFQTHPLIFLQSFTGILSLTALVFTALTQEREAAQNALKKMIESLENQVECQTCELVTARQRLEIANQELEKLANTDPLTQVANRRCFDRVLEGEWRRLLRESQPLSLLMLDVDHFKAYNDFYGHPEGDKCLTQVAQALTRITHRYGDCVARYGGEEFTVLLPNTNLAGAVQVAENIGQIIEELGIRHEASPIQPTLTVSVGVASLIPSFSDSPQTLVEQADQALYQAKAQGRNRRWVYEKSQ